MKKVFIALVFSAAMPLTAVAGGADTFQPSWVSASGGGGHDHDDDNKSKGGKGGGKHGKPPHDEKPPHSSNC